MNFSRKNKNIVLVLVLVFFIYLPNLYFTIVGNNPVLSTTLKEVVYLGVTFSFIIMPLSFLRPKYYFGFLIFLLPFLYFDFYSIFLTKNQSTTLYYSAVLNTNYRESKELLVSNTGFFLISVLSFILYLIIWSTLDFNFKIRKNVRLYIVLFCLTIIGGVFVRIFKNSLKEDLYFESFKNSVWIYNDVYTRNSYPLGSIRKVYKVLEGKRKLKDFIVKNSDFSYAIKRIPKESKTIVLVLGETARKHNFQLYGYERRTNPKLSEIDSLIVFKDVTTNANYTHISFPLILSSVNPDNFDDHLSELGISAAFKEAGYYTYWISNQNYNPGTIYHMYSDRVDKFIDVSLNQFSESFDEKILPFFKEVLNDKKKKRFIIIHTLGSHYMYNSRYPKKFSKYLPEIEDAISISKNTIGDYGRSMFVNSYDNSILYTDFILNSFIQELKKKSENSILLYLSDHGENIYDDKRGLVLHGGATPTKFELEIPMLLWYSNGINKKNILKLKSNSFRKISSSVIFHTLSSLGGFKTKLHKSKFDLISDSLDVRNRLFYSDEYNIFNIDSISY